MDEEKTDLNFLLVFEALMKARNVTDAGALLGLSQPATSYALARLRERFDDPLFVRTPKGMQPTPLAQAMAEPVAQVLKIIRSEILYQSEFDPATSRRRFTINMTDIAELTFLPRFVPYMAEHAPQCDLRVVDLRPQQLAEALESGEVDMAWGYFPDLVNASIYQQRLFTHGFVCLVREDHPRIGERLTLAQFLEEPHAVVRPEGRSHEIFERVLQERGLTRRVQMSLPHFMSVPLVVVETDLIVTVPISLGELFARLARIKVMKPPIKVPTFDIKQHWHARFHKDPANAWLRKSVSKTFSAMSSSVLARGLRS